jgi:hypothetical protein
MKIMSNDPGNFARETYTLIKRIQCLPNPHFGRRLTTFPSFTLIQNNGRSIHAFKEALKMLVGWAHILDILSSSVFVRSTNPALNQNTEQTVITMICSLFCRDRNRSSFRAVRRCRILSRTCCFSAEKSPVTV